MDQVCGMKDRGTKRMTIRFEALVCNGSLHSTSKLEAVSYSGSILCLDTEAQGQNIKIETTPQ